MSVNRHLPHLMVLPEDDANRQIATGFALCLPPVGQRQLQVMPVAGGWLKAISTFHDSYKVSLRTYAKRLLVLLIDFDSDASRLQCVREEIPADLAARVFVLGVWSEPEQLRKCAGTYESIGVTLANECNTGSYMLWEHELLKHNRSELLRLRDQAATFLFSQ